MPTSCPGARSASAASWSSLISMASALSSTGDRAGAAPVRSGAGQRDRRDAADRCAHDAAERDRSPKSMHVVPQCSPSRPSSDGQRAFVCHVNGFVSFRQGCRWSQPHPQRERPRRVVTRIAGCRTAAGGILAGRGPHDRRSRRRAPRRRGVAGRDITPPDCARHRGGGWHRQVDAVARGMRPSARSRLAVLATQPSAAEGDLAFAGLGDLFDSVAAAVLPALTPPRRRAMEGALLLDESSGPVDSRALGVAVRDALIALAGGPPVLVAIDDEQWLDGSTADALVFALRRLDAPVRLLLARRLGPAPRPALANALAPGDVVRIRIGPLDLEATRRLIEHRLGRTFDRPTVRQIHATAGGNAFYALEIARALPAEIDPTPPFPIPDDLDALMATRLDVLPAAARPGLAIVAASGARRGTCSRRPASGPPCSPPCSRRRCSSTRRRRALRPPAARVDVPAPAHRSRPPTGPRDARPARGRSGGRSAAPRASRPPHRTRTSPPSSSEEQWQPRPGGRPLPRSSCGVMHVVSHRPTTGRASIAVLWRWRGGASPRPLRVGSRNSWPASSSAIRPDPSAPPPCCSPARPKPTLSGPTPCCARRSSRPPATLHSNATSVGDSARTCGCAAGWPKRCTT